MPWLPKYVQENPATRWIQVDVDAIKKDFPMWGFAADVRHQHEVVAQVARDCHAVGLPLIVEPLWFPVAGESMDDPAVVE